MYKVDEESNSSLRLVCLAVGQGREQDKLLAMQTLLQTSGGFCLKTFLLSGAEKDTSPQFLSCLCP